MTVYSVRPEAIRDSVSLALGDKVKKLTISLGEVTVQVAATDYHASALALRDSPGCQFEQLVDLCGVDYSEYKDGAYEGSRYCVVTHLLSVSLNQRLRLKVFALDDAAPALSSVTDIWSGADWFEREAFDLYGIVFEGHEDLRQDERVMQMFGLINACLENDRSTRKRGYKIIRYTVLPLSNNSGVIGKSVLLFDYITNSLTVLCFWFYYLIF